MEILLWIIIILLLPAAAFYLVAVIAGLALMAVVAITAGLVMASFGADIFEVSFEIALVCALFTAIAGCALWLAYKDIKDDIEKEKRAKIWKIAEQQRKTKEWAACVMRVSRWDAEHKRRLKEIQVGVDKWALEHARI